MNRLSIALNVVLVIAVGILYYLHFTCNASCGNETSGTDSLQTVAPPIIPKDIKASRIVYINSDVLNEKYDFVKDLTASAQARQQQLEKTYQSKAQKLQEDFAAFQQKAQQGLLSENQAAAAQEELMKRKEDLDKMELQLQSLMDEVQKSNEEVRMTVINYLKEYNRNSQYNYVLTYTEGPGGIVILANDSLDITNEIVAGLNEQYHAKKDAKKK